ncbi:MULTISPECIES: NAD-glutamate dehydrogenase [unclassified Roseitalea]|uniref:NAD-glutamate dehydrogenase n=1 Tax=unclassified Roseitalea TaxID=2639107 RepID=UPI00273D88C7|nr:MULTISPECIES: NAD-glutamate dehydrogenase [unclassified Roseitalea]
MVQKLSAAAKRALSEITDALDEQSHTLAERLVADAHAEDLSNIAPDLLARAIAQTARTLARHRPGKSLVEVAADPEATPVSMISVINDNMPFLFDSVLGEINDKAPRVEFVVHPVLDIQHDHDTFEIIDTSRPGMARQKTNRVSVICAIVDGLDEQGNERLADAIGSTLGQVAAAVRDWPAMLARLDEVVTELRSGVLPARKSDVREAIAFLQWLHDDNFTFLGIREYDYVGGEKRGKLQRAERPALGILSDPEVRILRRGGEPVTTTPQIRAFLNSRDVLIVTKANLKSVVHRRTYMDYIGIKRYDEKGKLSGELRLVGLFTSTAYTRSVQRIPYIRSKIDAVLKRSHHEPDSHSGKALLNVLESYPRDELFQIDVPMLTRNAEAIVALADRPRVRVLSRIDAFDRFVSVIVFVPRDKYSSRIREDISAYLADAYDGHVSAWYPSFPEGTLARVHVIIGRSGGKTPTPGQAALERDIAAITRTWQDNLLDALVEAGSPADGAMFAFPESYRDTVSPEQAVEDLRFIDAITPQSPIGVDFRSDETQADHRARLRIFHADEPVALSERVPVLENMGFRVISELTYRIGCDATGEDRPHCIWLHDMRIESADGTVLPRDDGALFEDGFCETWAGRIDNDGYNGLMLAAGMDARKATVLRAYGRYLKQAGIAYSQHYMADTLRRHPDFTRQLFELFDTRFNPLRHADPDEDTAVTEKHILAGIRDALADVPGIDDDTILRRFCNAITATLRTSYFNPGEDGGPRATLAFKLDPGRLDGLPAPRPFREIFVFGPQVEGVHLRFGPVARGGLRWSDRIEDYRTEVLGLVKAQQVKNAVIVPVGAKGGFLPRRLPTEGGREAVFEAGRQAYTTFVSALLSLTDNLDGEAVIPPPHTVRHDGDDPYLVVAADKGTASFSDTANAISQAHGFWLDDAFASGGSAGYDHKKMGITARGAWEAVKRHFREMDKDIQSEPFTVAGVGDMSGDVFGNGMLLSEKIRLIAAFDHRDIFIDPDPDPRTGFAERKRLFEMGRSSWQDYDTSKLSRGGGIFPRSQKLITLSTAAAEAIGLGKVKASPFEIMQAILKADVELMWFGGIGTYVRATGERDADVGDRANDAIRITAPELRASVVGEGANLGMTQRARIEYGLAGGRCNSDAIDNSAGVNSSDLEVNIKIALSQSLKDGDLQRKARDKLLSAMTQSVADLVLRNNYEQTLTITRAHRTKTANLALQARLMEQLEERGALDRAVELLPDEEALADRRKAGIGLARAEIGVLLSYAKIVLFDDLVRSPLPDDPYLEKDLLGYFPPRMRDDFADNIRGHRLRREIIATVLANQIVNRGGPSVISRFEDATGKLPSGIVRAHVVTRDAFDLETIHAAIDALDATIPGMRQMDLYEDLADAQRAAIGQFLKCGDMAAPIGEAVERLASARAELEPELLELAPEYLANWVRERHEGFAGEGLADGAAWRLAMLPIIAMTPDIIAAAQATNRHIVPTARGYFDVTKSFRIGRLEHLAHKLSADDYFDGLAQQRALDTIHAARLAITTSALSVNGADPSEAVEAWVDANKVRIARVQDRIADLTDHGELTVSRLTVAAGLLGDLVA